MFKYICSSCQWVNASCGEKHCRCSFGDLATLGCFEFLFQARGFPAPGPLPVPFSLSANRLPPPQFHMAGASSFFPPLFKYHLLKEASMTIMSAVGLLVTATSPIPFLSPIIVFSLVFVTIGNYFIIYVLNHHLYLSRDCKK